MTGSYCDNELTINGKTIALGDKIVGAEELSDPPLVLVCVYPKNSDPERNVYAYALEGNLVWQIQRALPGTVGSASWAPFGKYKVLTELNARINTLSGYSYIIDLTDGSVSDPIFAR